MKAKTKVNLKWESKFAGSKLESDVALFLDCIMRNFSPSAIPSIAIIA